MRKSTNNSIPLQRLRELLDYNPETGVFVWKVRTSRRMHVGDIAGVLNGDGSVRIMVDGVRFMAHRLAWFYVTGEWPKHLIDHRNRKRSDNRFFNLREATPLQNQHNRGTAKGYTWNKKLEKWVASVRVNYKLIYLGAFKEEREARAAYLAGCIKYHGAEWTENKEAV